MGFGWGDVVFVSENYVDLSKRTLIKIHDYEENAVYTNEMLI